jgi:hypothetical protein
MISRDAFFCFLYSQQLKVKDAHRMRFDTGQRMADGEQGATKRALRVTQWLSTTPAIAMCSSCGEQLKVPMSALTKTRDAQVNFQQQFDLHACKHRTAG